MRCQKISAKFMSFSGHAYKLLKDLQNDAKKQD